jgi:hypothetical protein
MSGHGYTSNALAIGSSVKGDNSPFAERKWQNILSW